MSYASPSDEVAEDYTQALRALEMNSRYEISNLTVIAKENTEHALAISEAVKTHIKQASPQKKLPAFYVLDSVVKNVGTPYTLFFGRGLYSTFMEAYALVDNSTRRKMDEMLKTWKEPVPGSMDMRPVFPPEVTRPIENALIKARTSALQQEQLRIQQQPFGRGRPMAAPYRQTPTPPGVGRPPSHPSPGYASNYDQQQYPPPGAVQQQYPSGGNQQYPPNSQAYPSPNNQSYPTSSYQQYPPTNHQAYPPASSQQYPPNGQQYPPATQQYPPQNQQYAPSNNVQQYPPTGQQYANHTNGNQPHGLPQRPPSQQYSQQTTRAQSWQPLSQAYEAPENSVDMLNRDVSKLITTSKADFAQNPWDSSIQTRLKALLDLQTILSSQQLPPDQIALIKNQVAQLSEAAQSSNPKVTPPQPTPPPAPVAAVQPPAQQPSLSSLLGPGALAALRVRQSSTPQPTPPAQSAAPVRSPPPHPQPAFNAPSVTPSTPTPVPDTSSLLERLRAAGILQGATPTSTPTLPSNGLAGKFTPGFPAAPFINTPPNSSRTPLAEIPNDVVLKPASLKLPRPHLISNLYEKLGAPCNQCGRRFHADEEGKKKKAAHLDWHFQSAHRLADAVMRGQHRSWYVDELDWIKSREVDADQPAGENSNVSGTAASAAAKDPKAIYLPVPDDAELKNAPCPICQEKFVSRWLDEEQDFVWMDAKQVGERIYHATCYEEAYGGKAQAQAKMNRGTPEPSVLGKRKAEDEHIAFRSKVKTEPQ